MAMNTLTTYRLLPRAILLSLGSLILLGLSLVQAQQPVPQYEEDPLDPRASDWKRVTSNTRDNEILGMLVGNQPLEVGKMDTYFKKDVFPHFTRIANATGVVIVDTRTKKTSAVLPKMRSDFRRLYFNTNSIVDNDEANKSREQLNKMLNLRLFQIVNNQTAEGTPRNYHPLVRFHAALFLSELNNENPGKQLPYAPALGNLYMLAASKKTPNVPESVRVVALKGIQQHSQAYKIDEARIVPLLVNDVILPWLTQTAPTGGLTQEGLDWIRRRALELALELNAKSSNPAKLAVANLPQLLAAIAADENAGISLRLLALNTLTSFKDPPAGIKDEDLGKAAGSIALASAKLQLHSIKTQPVPPDVAKPLKHDLTLLHQSLDVMKQRTPAIASLQEKTADLLAACDTRWEDVQDPDAMYKAIQKSAAALDMHLTGKATSALLPNFVKIPMGFTGADNAQIPGGARMHGGGGFGGEGDR